MLLSRRTEVALSLFDVAGRRVAARDPEALGSGSQTLRWQVAGIRPGLYFLVVRTDRGARPTERVMILR